MATFTSLFPCPQIDYSELFTLAWWNDLAQFFNCYLTEEDVLIANLANSYYQDAQSRQTSAVDTTYASSIFVAQKTGVLEEQLAYLEEIDLLACKLKILLNYLNQTPQTQRTIPQTLCITFFRSILSALEAYIKEPPLNKQPFSENFASSIAKLVQAAHAVDFPDSLKNYIRDTCHYSEVTLLQKIEKDPLIEIFLDQVKTECGNVMQALKPDPYVQAQRFLSL